MTCNGAEGGCDSCNGSGLFVLTECPWKHIDRNTLDAMQCIRAAEHYLPLAGGLLDQTQSFIDTLDWNRLEQRRWDSEEGE